MFGLTGFTDSFNNFGITTRSMSSIGTAPNNTSSPIISAPTKQFLFSKFTITGPAYGMVWELPSAVVASLVSNTVNCN